MKALPPELTRPALLSEAAPPCILLPTEKYGAPFLIAGDASNPYVVFLDGDYKFHSVKQQDMQHYSGLAVEGVQFELDVDSAFSLAGGRRTPGVLIRRDDILSIAAISDDAFRRATEIPIMTGLPAASNGEAVGFAEWRAFVLVGEDRQIVWEYSVDVSSQ